MSLKQDYYVYAHVRDDTNEVFYIGKGRKQRAWVKCRSNQFWKNIVNKTSYTVKIIESNLNETMSFERERYWIAFYGRRDLNKGTLVNLSDGGEGPSGAIVSEETKQKHRINTIGEKNPFYGKTHTEEVRRKTSERNKKMKMSNEFKEVLRERWKGEENPSIKNKGEKHHCYGKSPSQETKEKIRLSNSIAVKCFNSETGELIGCFVSAKVAYQQTGVMAQNIMKCCKNIRPNAGVYDTINKCFVKIKSSYQRFPLLQNLVKVKWEYNFSDSQI